MKPHYDTIVLGGGIMGLACAFEEVLLGKSVLVVDKHSMGTKSSWAAAGILTHRGCRNPRSSFRAFQIQSIESYPGWLAKVGKHAPAPSLFQKGETHVFTISDPDGEKLFRAEMDKLKREESTDYQIHHHAPHFLPEDSKSEFAHINFPREAYVRPREMLQSLIKATAALGGHFRDHVTVRQLKTDGKHLSVTLQEGAEIKTFSAGHAILAAGAWSGDLLSLLKLRIPIIPVKGQLMRVSRLYDGEFFVHGDGDFYLIPFGKDEAIAGVTTEADRWDGDFSDDGRDSITSKIRRFFGDTPFEIKEGWAGVRPRPKDRAPFLGFLDSDQRIIIVTGHYKSGIGMAPLSARCVSSLINQTPPPFDLFPFRPHRPKGLETL